MLRRGAMQSLAATQAVSPEKAQSSMSCIKCSQSKKMHNGPTHGAAPLHRELKLCAAVRRAGFFRPPCAMLLLFVSQCGFGRCSPLRGRSQGQTAVGVAATALFARQTIPVTSHPAPPFSHNTGFTHKPCAWHHNSCHSCVTAVSVQATRHVLLRPLARRKAATAAASCCWKTVERRAASDCVMQSGQHTGFEIKQVAGARCSTTAPQLRVASGSGNAGSPAPCWPVTPAGTRGWQGPRAAP